MSTSPLDDLPTRTPEHVGETESREALRKLIADPYFVIREEQERDYGVDLTIEALAPAADPKDRKPTNVRLLVQLKSSTKDANTDGSYSYSVDRTTLNYLLNHPRSFFVFYARDDGKLYYRWADDVLAEYERADPNWHTQASVTVRFSAPLDVAAVAAINEGAIRAAREERDLRLKLKLQGVALTGAFQYDGSTARLTDSARIVEYLSTRGLALASHGHPSEVLRLGEQVPPAALTSDAWLALAYASYLVSRPGSAFEQLKCSDAPRLSSDNARALHAFVGLTVRRSLGLVSTDELVAQSRLVESRFPDTVSTIYASLQRLRYEGITADTDAHRARAEEIASSLQVKGAAWAPVALQASLVELELRYYIIQRAFTEQVINTRMSESLGLAQHFVRERAEIAAALDAQYRKWTADFETTLRTAEGLGIDQVVAEGLATLSGLLIQNTLTDDKLVPDYPGRAEQRKAQMERVLGRLAAAKDIFTRLESHEQALHAQLRSAEALWLLNRKADAIALAREIATSAAVHGLAEVRAKAEKVVNGESPVAPFDEIPALHEE